MSRRSKALIAKADVSDPELSPRRDRAAGARLCPLQAQSIRGIVYASITGYGEDGPWAKLPGQDLLAQARSGLMWLNGDRDQGPVPFGLAIADLLAGSAIVQGVLAALVRRGRTGEGAHIETSLLEALVDFQFEVLTTYLNDGGRMPKRSEFRNAHAYLAAPYGVYETQRRLACARHDAARQARDSHGPARDRRSLPPRRRLRASATRSSACSPTTLQASPRAYWLARMQPADIWCAEVLDWPALFESEAFRRMDMLQTVVRGDGPPVHTTRSPIRVDGERERARSGAPRIGEHTAALRAEFGL